MLEPHPETEASMSSYIVWRMKHLAPLLLSVFVIAIDGFGLLAVKWTEDDKYVLFEAHWNLGIVNTAQVIDHYKKPLLAHPLIYQT